MSIKLRNLIETEIRKTLTENAIVEPSEQVLKEVLKELKAKTGIIALPTVIQRSTNSISYEADMSKEIRTPIMRNLFKTLTLDLQCREIPQTIGGYSFEVSINYEHPQGGTNGKNIAVILFKDGKVTSRIF